MGDSHSSVKPGLLRGVSPNRENNQEIQSTADECGDNSDLRSKSTLYVGQLESLFSKGAKFDGITRLQIHPPPPGCSPNELQTLLMNGEKDIVFVPSSKRNKDAGLPFKSKAKIVPDVTAAVNIPLAGTPGDRTGAG